MNVIPVIGLAPQPQPEPSWRIATRDALLRSTCTARLDTHAMLLVGSTAINGFGNDIDVVIVCTSLEDTAAVLSAAGWIVNTAEVYRGITSDGWFSARLGEINLLVSAPDVAVTWSVATEVCKVFASIVNRPTSKEERVAFHRAVFKD